MKTNHLFLLLALLLFSCEGERIDYTIIERSIKVSGHISGVRTRATGDSWSEGDAIGIYMVEAGMGLAVESILAQNAKYVTESDGLFYPAAVDYDVKFPLDGSDVDFIAYYPYGTISSNFEYMIDVADQADQSTIDLLYADNARGLNKDSSFVDLTFTHQLSKLLVYLNTTDGSPLRDAAVTVRGVNTKGTFSLVNRTITTSDKGDIAMKMNGDGTVAEAIVLPADTLGGASLEIINGEYGYRYDLGSSPAVTAFEPGYKYTYTIELDTRSPLDVKTEVIDWLDGPSVTVTVEKEFEVYRPVGEGTPENPYTLEDARNIAPVSGVWVEGFIVGYYSGTSVGSFTNDLTDTTKIKMTSMALADSPDETNAAKTFPVSLPSGEIRNNLNLKSHPENLGKAVKIKGKIDSYYGTRGMPDVTSYMFVADH